MRVSSAEFLDSYEALIEKASAEPVIINRNGRDHVVLLSIEEYDRLKRRDRRVYRTEDLTAEQMEALARAEVPAEFHHLNDELKDWKP